MNQIPSNSCFPVRPIESISPVCIPCMPVRGIDGEDEGWEEVADSHIPAATGSLETNGPEDIVGLDSDVGRGDGRALVDTYVRCAT